MRPLVSPTQRDRSRTVLTVLSGGLAAATFAGTGVATAAAARETAREEAAKAEARARAEVDRARAHHEALAAWAADNPVVVTEPLPVRTVVGPEVVARAAAPGSARVGGSSNGPSASSGSGSSRPAPPPPPPVTSTGS